ncbi:hypothetical protein BJ165DRAFT_1409879 [Panaeolus papilionaceus]|nr:hypothetical protein BJ165DRAFT_1409879 [Panaeolus papilionaceus]
MGCAVASWETNRGDWDVFTGSANQTDDEECGFRGVASLLYRRIFIATGQTHDMNGQWVDEESAGMCIIELKGPVLCSTKRLIPSLDRTIRIKGSSPGVALSPPSCSASSYHTVGEGPSAKLVFHVQEKKAVIDKRRPRTLKVEDDELSPRELWKLLVETRQALTNMQAEHSSAMSGLAPECSVVLHSKGYPLWSFPIRIGNILDPWHTLPVYLRVFCAKQVQECPKRTIFGPFWALLGLF